MRIPLRLVRATTARVSSDGRLGFRGHHLVMVPHVLDQLSQGLFVKEAPGGGDRSRVEDPSPFGALPIDDLCDRLVFTKSRRVSFGIEIEHVSLVLATC